MTAAESPPRARLGRYALWHLRDYLRDKGVGTFITIGLLGFMMQFPIARARGAGFSGPLLEQAADRAFVLGLEFLAYVGVLFATNGIVADDRRHGYYRLLFAKPVGVVQYYAQKWAVYGIGFVVVAAVLLAVHGATVERFYPATFLPAIALFYVALGGIGFLLSAAWRFDWLSLAVVLGVSNGLWQLLRDVPGLPGSLVAVLPPVHLLGGICGAVREGGGLPLNDMLWLGLYGLACFVAGLVVVRRRPLAGP